MIDYIVDHPEATIAEFRLAFANPGVSEVCGCVTLHVVIYSTFDRLQIYEPQSKALKAASKKAPVPLA